MFTPLIVISEYFPELSQILEIMMTMNLSSSYTQRFIAVIAYHYHHHLFVLLLLLAFGGGDSGSTAVFAVSTDSFAGKIIAQVTTFKQEYEQELQKHDSYMQLRKGGVTFLPNQGKKIEKKHAEHKLFFEYNFNILLQDFLNQVQEFFVATEQKKYAKKAGEANKAMKLVQTALDKLEIDPELLSRLHWDMERQPFYSGPPAAVDTTATATEVETSVKRDYLKNLLKGIGTSKSGTVMLLQTVSPGEYPCVKHHLQRVYEWRVKCNEFVHQMRQQLLLRQPPEKFLQLRKLIEEDGKLLRNGEIRPFINEFAKEITMISNYAKEKNEELNEWRQKSFVFPHEKGAAKSKMTEQLEHYKIYSHFAAELTNHLKEGKLMLEHVRYLLEYPLNGLAKEEQQLIRELYPLAYKINETVDKIYQEFQTIFRSDLKALKDYDLLNAASLVLHKKLQTLAQHQHVAQQKREMTAMWLLANHWLHKTMQTMEKRYRKGYTALDVLQNNKHEWEMPKELEVDAIRDLLSPAVRKRIFYSAAHLLFLYEELNKQNDIDTLVGAKKNEEEIMVMASYLVDWQLHSEIREAVEKEGVLTPMGVIFCKNALGAQDNDMEDDESAKKSGGESASAEK